MADNPKYVIEERGQTEVKGKGLMITYWLRGLADGSKWNNEYDGFNLVPSSTFEYYKEHGLPTPTTANGCSNAQTKTDTPSLCDTKESRVCIIL